MPLPEHIASWLEPWRRAIDGGDPVDLKRFPADWFTRTTEFVEPTSALIQSGEAVVAACYWIARAIEDGMDDAGEIAERRRKAGEALDRYTAFLESSRPNQAARNLGLV